MWMGRGKKTLTKKNKITMTKEQICIDLSKCTQEERKNIYKTLVDAGEKMWIENTLNEEGYYDPEFPRLAIDEVDWTEHRYAKGKTAISYDDFISFFKPKQTNPFKVGDKVYCGGFGWGKVTEANRNNCTVLFEGVGKKFCYNKHLSFTEYTMQGFSQERPIDYEQMAKDKTVGWFWDVEGSLCRVLGILNEYVKENTLNKFKSINNINWQHFRPLTPEEKAVLEKNELFNEIFKK